MTITIMSPYGPSSHVFSNLGVIGWSPNQPQPVFLNPDGTEDRIGWSEGVTIGRAPSGRPLIVTSGGPNAAAEGATIDPIWAAIQSPITGSTIKIYWEITLNKIGGALGIGVCDINALRAYGNLATNGKGGIIYYPGSGTTFGNGTKYVDNMGGNLGLAAASNGDTVGLLVSIDGSGTGLGLGFSGVGGSIANTSGGTFELNTVGPYGPPSNDFSLPGGGSITAVVPVVVFAPSTPFGTASVTANFGAGVYDANGNLVTSGPDTFLGLPELTDPSVGFYAGWPAFNFVLPPVKFPQGH